MFVYEFLKRRHMYLHNYCYHATSEKFVVPKGDSCGIVLSGSAVGGVCEVCPEPDGLSSSCAVIVGAAPKKCIVIAV